MGRRGEAAVLALGCAGLAALAAESDPIARWAAPWVARHRGIFAALCVVLGSMCALLLPLLAVQVAALLRHQLSAVVAATCTARLRRLGLTAWAIGPWAAWPPHDGSGRALIDELLPLLPSDVWLVASAANHRVAARLRRRGFFSPPGYDLLCLRLPAGIVDVPAAALPSPRSRPAAAETGQ